MKVLLSDGRTIGFRTQYELTKFILFGAPKMGVLIQEAPKLKVTPETEPLFRAKRRIDQRIRERQIAEFEHDDHIPF
ncbi:MAG: hypothetical protein ACRC6V_09320 [Bacteroidales bacterium]